MASLRIYTDGGCSGNPGPGAWAYIIDDGDRQEQASGYCPQTTNNRMELQAVIAALRAVQLRPQHPASALELFTDSQYVRNGISSWIHTWVKNGWRTSGKNPVKNQDLWQELIRLARPLQIRWHWLQAHAGHRLNEACDRLVRQAIKRG